MLNGKTVVCSNRSRNCQGIDLSSRDFKTVTISVTRAKLYCIHTWFACMSPTPEAQSPAGNLASVYPPKPLLFEISAQCHLQYIGAKFHHIWAWFTPISPTADSQPYCWGTYPHSYPQQTYPHSYPWETYTHSYPHSYPSDTYTDSYSSNVI